MIRLKMGIVMLGVAACAGDGSSGPGTPALGSLSLAAEFPAAASGPLALAGVRITVFRSPADTLHDSVATLNPLADSLALHVPLVLRAQQETLTVSLTYLAAGGVTLFTGQSTVVVRAGVTPPVVPVPVQYVGPGANTASLQILPIDTILPPGGQVQLDVVALDGSGNQIADVYVSWSVSDSSGSISPAGLFQGPLVPDQIQVTATTPTGVTATALVITAVSGIAVVPDSIELLPGASTTFTLLGGPGGRQGPSWLVNGLPGGDSLVGFISGAGTYRAPLLIPAGGAVDICAALAVDTACARAFITPILGG